MGSLKKPPDNFHSKFDATGLFFNCSKMPKAIKGQTF